MSEKRIKRNELNQYIQNELILMINEGVEKSPIKASTVHARLKMKGVIKGGLSTLSTTERKKLIEDARQRQHNVSGFSNEEHQQFASGRTATAYIQKAKRFQQQRDSYKEKYQRNILAVASLIEHVDSATPIQVEKLLAEDLIRELAEKKRSV